LPCKHTLAIFLDAVFPRLTGDHPEVGFGPTAAPAFSGRLTSERETFDATATRFPVRLYA
jgi:uncharacterized oxidoreductase